MSASGLASNHFEEYPLDKTNFKSILDDIKEEMPGYLTMSSEVDSFICTISDIRVYINNKVDYISFDIADKDFVLTYRTKDNGYELDFYKGKAFFSDKIELLMIDTLEKTIQKMREVQHKERISFEKLIDVLFSRMVERRTREKAKIENDSSIKIVKKEIAKTYI